MYVHGVEEKETPRGVTPALEEWIEVADENRRPPDEADGVGLHSSGTRPEDSGLQARVGSPAFQERAELGGLMSWGKRRVVGPTGGRSRRQEPCRPPGKRERQRH